MSFDKHQETISEMFQGHSALTSEQARLLNWTLGLPGEVGEVTELIKHHVFHGEPLDLGKVAKEIGDILWYVTAICTTLGISLEACAELNVAKLTHRYGGFAYNRHGSVLRKDRESKFEETEEYQNIMRRVERGRM